MSLLWIMVGGAGVAILMALLLLLLWRSNIRTRAQFKALLIEKDELIEQVNRLKHRAKVLARTLSERDDTPNKPDDYVRHGLSADFREDGARPAAVSAESYIHDDEISQRRGQLLAAKPKHRGPPVLPRNLIEDYCKSAVNE